MNCGCKIDAHRANIYIMKFIKKITKCIIVNLPTSLFFSTLQMSKNQTIIQTFLSIAHILIKMEFLNFEERIKIRLEMSPWRLRGLKGCGVCLNFSI